MLSTLYLMIKLTEATKKKFCGFGNSTVNSNVVSGNGFEYLARQAVLVLHVYGSYCIGISESCYVGRRLSWPTI